jgi:hypothetical protein
LQDAITNVINKITIMQIQKEKMEVALQRKAQSLKLDILRLHQVMEKMKNMEPYYS